MKVETLDQTRLLSQWLWLCPQPVTVIDRNVYGDLFLRDELGRVHWLDVGSGKIALIADSVAEFEQHLLTPEKRNEWFCETEANEAAEQGLVPGDMQCIAFDVPVVFEEGANNSAYIVDIYDCVGFLGDLHRQLVTLPDGTKVEVVIKPPPRDE